MKPLTIRIQDKIRLLKYALSDNELHHSDRMRLQSKLIECEDDALLLKQYKMEQNRSGTTTSKER